MISNLELQYYVIITNRNDKKKFIELLKEYHAFGIQTIYAKGSYKASILQKAFGLNVERNKVYLTGLLHKEEAIELTNVLNEVYQFSRPNTGIAFSIKLESVGY